MASGIAKNIEIVENIEKDIERIRKKQRKLLEEIEMAIISN